MVQIKPALLLILETHKYIKLVQLPFKSNNTDLSGVALNINAEATKTAKLYFNADASLGVDRGHEAQAFGKAISNFGIYTQLADNSRIEPLAVQTIPTTGLENTI